MAVPKKRTTSSKRNMRRSHHGLKATSLSTCSHCKRPAAPHRMCEQCGYYDGEEVVDVLAKLTKRERKKQEKKEERELAEREAAGNIAKDEHEAKAKTKT